jgi:uncharacterized protein
LSIHLSESLRCAHPFVRLADMKLFITLIGLILVIEGLPYVACPEAMQRWLRQLTQIPPAQLRVVGLVAMACGFGVLYFARFSGFLQ